MLLYYVVKKGNLSPIRDTKWVYNSDATLTHGNTRLTDANELRFVELSLADKLIDNLTPETNMYACYA